MALIVGYEWTKHLDRRWTTWTKVGQSRKNRSIFSSRKQPQEASRGVRSHKIVTLQKSSHNTPPIRMNRHTDLCGAQMFMI